MTWLKRQLQRRRNRNHKPIPRGERNRYGYPVPSRFTDGCPRPPPQER